MRRNSRRPDFVVKDQAGVHPVDPRPIMKRLLARLLSFERLTRQGPVAALIFTCTR